MSTRKIRRTASAIAAAAALLSAGAVQAVTPEFGAYMRSSAGASSEGGNIVCYRLPGSVVWFRLGNECDSYVDLKFGATLGTVDGTTFKSKVTWSNGTQGLANWEQYSPSLRELFVEAQDIGAAMSMPSLKGANLWIGKRFYKNPDIHMLDYTYWEPAQGPGFGLDNVDAGIGKFSYALIRIGDGTGYGINPGLQQGSSSPDLIGGGTRTATVHDFRLQDIATNPGGKLTVGVDLVHADNRKGTSTYTVDTTQLVDLDNDPATPDVEVVVRETRTIDNKPGKNGVGLTFTHEQSNLFGLGGSNTVGLQVARNAVALKGFGYVASTEDRKEWLLFDHWYMAPAGSKFSATSTAGYRHSEINGSTVKELWIGARPTYNLNNIWSLFTEVGYQQLKQDDEATRKLAKLTLGTAFSMGPGVWARPSLRFFVTYAKWNDAAANAGAVACSGRDCGRPADGFDDKRSALTYGAQLEAWF
jgi:maltoporin